MKTVVANGCFDCLHAGHVSLLRFAREQGDKLIVLVNTDESIRRLKGPSRPLMPLRDRITVLESIRYVDQVIAFDEDTPDAMLAMLRPDVLVKGADNIGKQVPGAEHCGRVAFAPLVDGVSTTKILECTKR